MPVCECPLAFEVNYSDVTGKQCQAAVECNGSGGESTAREFLTQSVAVIIKDNRMKGSRKEIRKYITAVCADLALPPDTQSSVMDMFMVINDLMTTPALAKTPSQRDHVSGLLHAISSNPSAGVPTNLQEALTDATLRVTTNTPHFPGLYRV